MWLVGVVSDECLPDVLVIFLFEADSCESAVVFVGSDGVGVCIVGGGFSGCVCDVDECTLCSCE